MSMTTTTGQDNLRSRLPDPNEFIPEVAEIARAMFKATLNGSIPETTIHLVQLRAGQIVGNTYHTVRQTGDLRKAGETEERITAGSVVNGTAALMAATRLASVSLRTELYS